MITVLLNPAAGANHPQEFAAELAARFSRTGAPARIITLQSAAEIEAAVRAAVDSGSGAVVAAGGDGTVSRVAAALAGSETPLGVLPLGSLNHFARDAGIPLDLDAAVRTIAERRTVRVDVGDVNGRLFLNNSSIGIYPDIVVERESLRGRGYRKWPAFVMATAGVLGRYPGVVVSVSTPGASRVYRTPFLFVGNNEYEVEGIRIGSRANLESGRLFACLAPRLRARDLPMLAALALAGRAKADPALESFSTPALHVATPGRRRVRTALDGEVTWLTTPLQYRVRPRALNVVVAGRGGERDDAPPGFRDARSSRDRP